MQSFLTKHPASNPFDNSADVLEAYILRAEQVRLGSLFGFTSDEILMLSKQLISIYDAPFCVPVFLRERAARIVATLAGRDNEALESVISNAEEYAKHQHCGDAFPYSPNAFEVLSEIRPISERVTSFLRMTVRNDFGIASWSASQALEALAIGTGVA